MAGIKDKILATVKDMSILRAESSRLREGWPSIEREVFSLLDAARIRPAFIAYAIEPGQSSEYFRLDWIERKLIEVKIEDFVVTLDQLDLFGNLSGDGNDDSDKGMQDVHGIASAY